MSAKASSELDRPSAPKMVGAYFQRPPSFGVLKSNDSRREGLRERPLAAVFVAAMVVIHSICR